MLWRGPALGSPSDIPNPSSLANPQAHQQQPPFCYYLLFTALFRFLSKLSQPLNQWRQEPAPYSF